MFMHYSIAFTFKIMHPLVITRKLKTIHAPITREHKFMHSSITTTLKISYSSITRKLKIMHSLIAFTLQTDALFHRITLTL